MAKFTRQHYNAIANFLSERDAIDPGMIDEFSNFFEQDNPRFSRTLFQKAATRRISRA